MEQIVERVTLNQLNISQFNPYLTGGTVRQDMDIIQTKPELSILVPKPFLVIIPSAVEIHRAVESFLNSCPASPVRFLVTVDLDQAAWDWCNGIHTTAKALLFQDCA